VVKLLCSKRSVYIETPTPPLAKMGLHVGTRTYIGENILIVVLEDSEDNNNCAGEGQQQFNRPTDLWLCQLKVVVVKSEKRGTVWEPRGRGVSAVGSHYQATASGD
jgi:hypothetical protein